MPGASGKPQQYGRDGGGHNVRDGYANQPPPPRQWENRGGYRSFVPGGMGCVSNSCLIPFALFSFCHNFLRINALFVILLACIMSFSSLAAFCTFLVFCFSYTLFGLCDVRKNSAV